MGRAFGRHLKIGRALVKKIGRIVVVGLLGSTGIWAADEDQVKWVKLEEARAKSLATGKPVLVICVSDLIPDGPGTKGIDRSWTSELIKPHKDDYFFVKGTDQGTIKAVKATSKCELITFDPDGDEIFRGVVKSTQDIVEAMKTTNTRYQSQPIHWASEAPAPGETSTGGRKLTVLLFKDGSDDASALVQALEDRSVVKYHARLTFVALTYRKDLPEVARWKVQLSPTLILLDPAKEFGPGATLERVAEKKTPRELRALFRKHLASLEKGRH